MLELMHLRFQFQKFISCDTRIPLVLRLIYLGQANFRRVVAVFLAVHLDRIIILHVELSWRLRPAHPVSVKEKEDSLHFKPLKNAVLFDELIENTRLLDLEPLRSAILALDLEMHVILIPIGIFIPIWAFDSHLAA
jgi:hypothetical protein